MTRLTALILIALAVPLVGGCGGSTPSDYPTQPTAVGASALGAGDSFEVRVYRQEELSNTYRVGSGGSISFPLIGRVEVAGKSPEEIEAEIQRRLADGYLIDPQVSVVVEEFQSMQLSLSGQVQNPGTIPYADGMTIIEALSRAGGFTDMARQNSVTVTREREDGEEVVQYTIPVADIRNAEAPDFFVRPGDVIHVPERLF